jgi:hypothetical protein
LAERPQFSDKLRKGSAGFLRSVDLAEHIDEHIAAVGDGATNEEEAAVALERARKAMSGNDIDTEQSADNRKVANDALAKQEAV